MTEETSSLGKFISIGLRILITILVLNFNLQARRIITLAPALTEIVFALGDGEQLVGNTRFCDFPPEAKTIAKVGGLMDLNVEMIIDLKPDIVILYPESLDKIKILQNKIELLVVRHNTLDHITQSIISISRMLGKEKKATHLVSGIRETLHKIQNRARTYKKKRTLLIAGRNPDQLRNMTIIGKKDFLNTVLEIAGGVNAYSGNIDYPSISIESIFSMNPDHIIEFSVFFAII